MPEGSTQFCSLRCGSAVPSELEFNITITGGQQLIANDRVSTLPRPLTPAELAEYQRLRGLPGVGSVLSRFSADTDDGYACPGPVDPRYGSRLVLVDDTGTRRSVGAALGCLMFGPTSADPEVRDLGELLTWLLTLSRELAQCEATAASPSPNDAATDAGRDAGEAVQPRALCHYDREGE